MGGDLSGFFTALSNFGALGILVGFLMWKDTRAENARRAVEERKIAYDRERLEADKALAASLAALTSAVQARGGK